MYDALGDPLVVEMEEFVPEVEVLERRWPPLPYPQRVLIVTDDRSLAGGKPLKVATW